MNSKISISSNLLFLVKAHDFLAEKGHEKPDVVLLSIKTKTIQLKAIQEEDFIKDQ